MGRVGRSLAITVALSMLSIAAAGVLPAFAGSAVGSFEIDGNLADPVAGEPIDWDTPPPNLTSFTDTVGKGDDIFALGSKELQPGAWICKTGSVPAKDDIRSGAIAFRELNGVQYAYVNFRRAATNGDAHMDWELNQSAVANPSCPALPSRTNGDIALTFDTENGGATIIVRAFRWDGNATTGVFTELPLGSKGVTFDGAVNIPNTIPGYKAGEFGEAAINLTDTIGTIECGEFAAAHMKTRASTSINSALKDRTVSKPIDAGNCPESELHKSVRNVTAGGAFAESAAAGPGDTIEFMLTYHNHGQAPATNVTITDLVPERSTFTTVCSDGCTWIDTAPGSTITWDLGTVDAGATRAVTFEVELDGTFPPGSTVVPNAARATSAEEGDTPANSNTVEVNVAAAPDSELHKAVRNLAGGEFGDHADAGPGDTIEYRLTYHNHGNAEAADVVIVEEVPEHSTFAGCSDGCVSAGDVPGSLITWSLGTVPAAGERVVTFQTVLDASFEQSTATITNVAGVTSSTESRKDSNSTQVTVAAPADSELAKAVRNVTAGTEFSESAAASPGETIEYRLTYRNAGSGPAHDVTITEEVPAHTTFDSCTGGCSTAGGVITWSLNTVPAGEERVVTFLVVLDDTFAATETTITNVASASSDQDSTDSNSTEVRVTALPASALEKAVRNETVDGAFSTTTTASPGDVIEYRLVYRNGGSGPADGVVVGEEVPAHSTFLSCSDSCVTSGDPVGSVSWSLGTVAAGDEGVVSFRVRLDEAFGSNTTDIENVATVTTNQEGDTPSNPAHVIVTALPDLALAKSADGTGVGEGDLVTYTLAYANDGAGPADDTVIRENVPATTEFVSCTGGCETTDGHTYTWSIGTVQAGGSGSVTMTVRVLSTVGCEICNVASIESPDNDNGAPVTSGACIDAIPGANPGGANASGSAYGLRVREVNPVLSIDETRSQVASSQGGVGADDGDTQLFDVTLPADGTLATADVLRSTASSTVTQAPSAARHTSVAEAVNVNLVGGLVTASLVRAVASTEATGASSAFGSVGSTFENLVVNGVARDDVAPNTRVDLPAALFGPDSYVALYERAGSASRPAAGVSSGGTYAADLAVNMINVHITDKAPLVPGLQPLDIVVSQAVAHSDFPQTTVCEETASQSVSGHAFMLSAETDPSVVPVLVGYSSIPASGGYARQHLLEASTGQATTGESTTESAGVLGSGISRASSYAEAADLCLLRSEGACTIRATSVRSQSSSTADPSGASSSPAGTVLVDLAVGSLTFTETPAANTVIELPGLGFVILNEQVPDAAAAGHAGLTVRSARVVVTVPENPFGLRPGAQIIVAEAHSDAAYL